MTNLNASYPVVLGVGSGIPTYATFADFPSAVTAGNGALAIALDTDTLYISNGTTWEAIGGPGVALSIGTFDSGTPSSNGAHIDGNALIMQSASASNPGLVNVSTQTFAGVKTFSSAPNFSSLTASLPLQLDASKNVISAAINLSTSEITGTLPINHGGTGQITAAAAFNALSPMTTAGDLIYGGVAGAGTRLGIGSSGNVLTVTGGNPVWAPPATSGTVTSVAMTVPTFLSISGSPITSSGTFAVTVANGTSGGILGYTGTNTLASSGLLTASQLIIGGGAGATPATLAAGSQFQVLVMGASNPGYGQVNLAQSAAITGTLPVGNGGTGQITAAAAFNALSPITTTGDMIYSPSGATSQRLAIGSSGNVLTVSGGVPTWAPPATSGTVTSVGLSVPATSILGVSGSPVTSSGTLGLTTTGTSGGIPYFSSTSQLASSALLTANQLIIGGGAGATPATLAAGSQFQVLVMGASNPGYGQVNLAQSAAITGTLPVGNGGTGQTSVTYAPGTTAGFIATSGTLGFSDGSTGTAGYVGEVIQSSNTSQSLPASGNYGDSTSISLTAGSWILTHQLYLAAAGAAYTNCTIGISTNTGNSSSGLTAGDNLLSIGNNNSNGYDLSGVIAGYVVNIGSTTTYYGKVKAGYSGGSPTYSSRLTAVRRR